MRLPDGEGLEIVRHIGEHYPQTPVAVITAYGSAGNAVAALKAGAFDYLSKPVGLEQLPSAWPTGRVWWRRPANSAAVTRSPSWRLWKNLKIGWRVRRMGSCG